MSLKASGALVCRTISFEGVEFRSLVHSLDAQQVPAVAPALRCCRLSRGPIAVVSLSQIEAYDQCTELFRRLQRCGSPFLHRDWAHPRHICTETALSASRCLCAALRCASLACSVMPASCPLTHE